MIKIINRYLFKEISLTFFLILLILTFVLLMGKTLRLMDLMVNKGVQFIDVAKLIAFLMPSMLVYTIPISLLIAILIGVGRLSSDNEITVMRSSGISLYQLFVPVLFFSGTAFLATAATSFLLVPAGNTATKNLLFGIAQQKASIGIQEKVFNDDFRGILIYADRIPQSGDYLEGVIISDRRPGQAPATIFAKRAYLISDPETLSLNLRLISGISTNADMRHSSYQHMTFQTYDINLNIGSIVSSTRKKDIHEMTFSELLSALPENGRKKETTGELLTEIYKKITIPFSCLIFAILALPLAIRPQRSAKARGFIIGLFIIVIYYLMQLGSDALVIMGRLSPLAGALGTTLTFLSVGILLFIASSRGMEISILTHYFRKG